MCILVRERGARRAALAMTLCACGSSAPVSSKHAARPTAEEWTGQRAGTPPPPIPSPSSSPSKGTWVLHVGDSFVDAYFSQNLRRRFEGEGARQVALAKTATYTTTWANDARLNGWLSHKPSLILVTLGANEVEIPVPGVHAPAVQKLARRLAAVAPCVWIAPPLWKEDATGWLQVIHDHCSPCLFFDSDAVLGGLTDQERRWDRIHPNERGGARWAEAFWGWLEDHREGGVGGAAGDGWKLRAFEQRQR